MQYSMANNIKQQSKIPPLGGGEAATTKQVRQARAIISTLPHYGEEDKNAAVLEISGGRTQHLRELSDAEMRMFILTLQRAQGSLRDSRLRGNDGRSWQPQDDNRTKMQRKIIAMAHEIGWHKLPSHLGEGQEVRLEKGRLKIDMQKINNWCVKKSYLHKEFNRYTYSELPRLVAQFEEMHRYYLTNLNK